MNSSTYKTIVLVTIAAMFVAATAFSSLGTAHANPALLFNASSKPTPPDQPLDSAKATEFVTLLAGETENSLDDVWDMAKVDQANDAIAAEFAKRGEMADKTPQQILDMFLEDVNKAVTDPELQTNISASLARLLVSSDEASNPPDNIPVPAPHETPTAAKLTEDGVAALKAKLEAALKSVVEDEEAQNGIIEVWNTQVSQMVGKTSAQMVDEFLKGAAIAVTEEEQMSKLRTSFTVAMNEGEPVGEPEPAPAPVQSAKPATTPEQQKLATNTEEDPKPVATPAAEPAPEPKPAVQPNTSTTLRQYIKSLTYDPKVLLAVQPSGGELIKEKSNTRETKPGKIVRCVRTKKSLSENFDDVAILQPTQGVIYPGALLYADQNLVDGQPRPLTGLPRAPIDLHVDLPGMGDESNFSIANPTDGKVQSAISKSLNVWNNGPAYREGYVTQASRQAYKSTIAYSSEQLALSLGVNVKWASGDAAAQFKFNMDNEKTVAVTMYKQVFYTVTYDAPNLPEQFFDSSVSVDEAKEAFHATKDSLSNDKQVPAYVSSVNYGRIIMFRLEADKSVLGVDAQAALNYGTGGVTVGVDAKAKYDKILSNSSITVVTMGGSADVAAQAVSARSANDLMPIIQGKNAVYSKTNPGVPIAYTVKFLKDNTIAKMGSTTDFTTTDCEELRNIWIKLVHNGWYTAHFDVTWDEEGKPNQKFHSDHNKDYQETLQFPGDSTNIRVKITNDTGLVWEPQREIINRPLVPTELNKCLIIEGTTLGSGKKFETCEKPPDEDPSNRRPQ